MLNRTWKRLGLLLMQKKVFLSHLIVWNDFGSTLIQLWENSQCQKKINALRSKVFQKPNREKNYTTSEKECLAIVWATRKFRHYLVGTTFTLETDHKPLEWLESHKQSHARSQCLERWSLELRAYDFRIMYRPGKDNLCADSLSRMPVSLVA